MNNDEKMYYVSPKGGKGVNPVAAILKTVVWCIWVGGFILGIAAGATVDKFSSALYYGGSDGNFSLGTMLIVWIISFIQGIFIYAFAEIITLLQKANNMAYSVGTELPDVRKINEPSTISRQISQEEKEKEKLIKRISTLGNAKEVLKFAEDEANYGNAIITQELLNILKAETEIEAGGINRHKEAVLKVDEYLSGFCK